MFSVSTLSSQQARGKFCSASTDTTVKKPVAGIRVCLPGKRTAVVSVTPLKVKYPVGHANHSEVAPTTIGTYVYI